MKTRALFYEIISTSDRGKSAPHFHTSLFIDSSLEMDSTPFLLASEAVGRAKYILFSVVIGMLSHQQE
jgi:hypothetical protein